MSEKVKPKLCSQCEFADLDGSITPCNKCDGESPVPSQFIAKNVNDYEGAEE